MRRACRHAFTLLEVVIALAILTVSLVVLFDSQATAVMMTSETRKIMTATHLAQEVMVDVQLMVERDGFGDEDLEEDGDFSLFWSDRDEDFDHDEDLEDYKWAWTVRKIDLSAIGDVAGMAGDLAGSGYFGEEATDEFDASQTPGLEDLASPDMITDMLLAYIREVRVLVWWGEDEDEDDRVEIVAHVINPSGLISSGGEESTDGEGEESSGNGTGTGQGSNPFGGNPRAGGLPSPGKR